MIDWKDDQQKIREIFLSPLSFVIYIEMRLLVDVAISHDSYEWLSIAFIPWFR